MASQLLLLERPVFCNMPHLCLVQTRWEHAIAKKTFKMHQEHRTSQYEGIKRVSGQFSLSRQQILHKSQLYAICMDYQHKFKLCLLCQFNQSKLDFKFQFSFLLFIHSLEVKYPWYDQVRFRENTNGKQVGFSMAGQEVGFSMMSNMLNAEFK